MAALKRTVSLITIVDNDYVIFSYKKFHKNSSKFHFILLFEQWFYSPSQLL